MASRSVQTRARGIPKAAEKKVKINAPEQTRPSPQRKPKVPANVPSQSWYTPAPALSPTNGALQRSVSNAAPRTTPSKVDVGKTNSTKEFRHHGRTESEVWRDGAEPTKRRVHKHLITHPDCPWVEPPNNPIAHHGYLAQHQPVRAATRGSYESDETAVEGEAPARVDAKKEEEATPLVRFVQDTLRPTVRLISKPLPDLPTFDSLSSRWSASTGSVYSDEDPFSYDKVLNMFPNPPEDMPNADRSNDWKDSNSLSTPPVFMSCPNISSSSVATITPTVAPEPSTVKPLMLKAAPKPKFSVVIHQDPHTSCSYTQLQDSIVIRDGCAYPQAPIDGNIHTSSIRTAGTASTLQRRSSSLTPSQGRNQLGQVAMPEALLWLHWRKTHEDNERIERERLERERDYETEDRIEWDDPLSMAELGFNLQYKGFSPDVEDRREQDSGTSLQDPETSWQEFGCIRPHKGVFHDVKERDPKGKDGCGLKGKGWRDFGHIRLCKKVSPDIKVRDLKGMGEDWRTWL